MACPSSDKEAVDRQDITEVFLLGCKEIGPGCLAAATNFSLSEAMSAIELMDPKMDVGLQRNQKAAGLETCREKGVFSMAGDEILATMDATMAVFVSWLEGNSIGQSLLTNVLLTEPNAVDAPILGIFGHAFSHIAQYVVTILKTAAVSEEEDFNFSIPYLPLTDRVHRDVIEELQSAEAHLNKEGTAISKAIAARFGWLRTFMQAILVLTPALSGVANKLVQNYPPDMSNFRPQLRKSIDILRACHDYSRAMVDTWTLGKQASDGIDGDFGWLPAFEPDFNRKHLPPTFPRKSVIQPRSTSLAYLVDLSESLLRIPLELPESLNDSGNLLEYFRLYGEHRCSTVFTRSFLQMVIFPFDDHVLGEVVLADIFTDTVIDCVVPAVLDNTTAAYHDAEAREAWEEFVQEYTKSMLNLVQYYGNNLTRLREKLVNALEDMRMLLDAALKVDIQSVRAMRENETGNAERNELTRRESSAFYTYILNETARLIAHHFELSFRLDLVAPYEYTYMYWYLGEVVKRSLCSGLDRAYTFILHNFKLSTSSSNKKAVQKQAKKEEKLRRRLALYQEEGKLLTAEMAMCDGMFRAAIGLSLLKKFMIPRWNDRSEEHRYLHRMAPFFLLHQPFAVSYAEYKQRSLYDSLASAGPSQLFSDAAEAFEMGRIELEKYVLPTKSGYAHALLRVCKNNAVVLRILAAGKMVEKRIHFNFVDSPVYPVLRLI
ncbi:unnamed protein product, partial [Mesorhabditis spiculigera]